jgi:hypothetical protein
MAAPALHGLGDADVGGVADLYPSDDEYGDPEDTDNDSELSEDVINQGMGVFNEE